MPNPLLKPSELPYQWPDFAHITADDYLQAARTGAQEHLAQIATIVADATPATFANTFLALERSGQLLRRTLMAYFSVLSARHRSIA